MEQTPLQLAAEHGTVEVVQHMMEHGAGSEQPGHHTLLHLAAYGGKLGTVQYLIQNRRYDPMIKDKDSKTPLHSASLTGELEIAKYLVDTCKVDVASCDNRYQESPLDMAAQNGQMGIVKYLVENKNCVVEHGTNNHNTALHHAAWGGALEVVKYFVEERKCNPSCQGRKGRTPLHVACASASGSKEVLDYLIDKHRVEVSCRDHHGATPLHLAARRGHLSLVKELTTEYGCDKLVKDNDGKTPLDYASDKHMATVIDFLSNSSESNKLLEEAMKEGYVILKLVRVIVVGPAGVGKTCLLYLLLSRDPPEERNSTGCVERSIRVIRICKEGEQWNEIDNEEFQKMIAEAVPLLHEELLKTKAKETVTKEEDETDTASSNTTSANQEAGNKDMSGERNESGEDSSVMDGDQNQDVSVGQPSVDASTSAKASIDEVIGKLIAIVNGGKSSSRLLEMELMYLTDTGGQQAYWDLVPIFTRDTSATIFTHRLCERLDEHPLNELYKSGRRVGPEQRARLTTADAFKTILRGLGDGRKCSKIITVGTHKDLVSECEESPDDKNKRFNKITSSHFSKDIVYLNESLNEVIFQVNAKKPGDDDKKEASKIRASIEETATEVKIPIWWFVLQQILEALAGDRQVLSKEECAHVSGKLGFSEGELDAALEFFDRLNVFLYKKDILPNVVFTNVQVPLDRLSEIVKKQYKLKAAAADPTSAADEQMNGDWLLFRDKGILVSSLLEEFKEHYVDDIFTADDFLLLLEKLLIVSKLSANNFFFPAILNVTKDSEINDQLTSPSELAPMVVHFPNGWAPPGVFCCSVCHLLQSHTGWKIKTPAKNDDKDAPETDPSHTISRTSITFTKHGRPCSVTFIDKFLFFVVCVNVDTRTIQGDSLIKLCETIKSEVLDAVKAGLQITHHKEWRDTIKNEVLATVKESIRKTRHKESCVKAINDEVSAAVEACADLFQHKKSKKSGPVIIEAIKTRVKAAVENGLSKIHHTKCFAETTKNKVSAEVEKCLEGIERSNVDPELAFLCPAHLNESELHTACVSEFDKLWICDKDPDISGELGSDQTVWLGGPAPSLPLPKAVETSEVPMGDHGQVTMPDMIKLSKKIKILEKSAVKCRRIGIILLNDKGGATVHNIMEKERGDNVEAMEQIYMKWIAECEDHSWKKLAQCFREVELNHLARDVEQHFGLPSPSDQADALHREASQEQPSLSRRLNNGERDTPEESGGTQRKEEQQSTYMDNNDDGRREIPPDQGGNMAEQIGGIKNAGPQTLSSSPKRMGTTCGLGWCSIYVTLFIGVLAVFIVIFHSLFTSSFV